MMKILKILLVCALLGVCIFCADARVGRAEKFPKVLCWFYKYVVPVAILWIIFMGY